MEIQQPWFDYIISGRKRVEGRKGTPRLAKITNRSTITNQ